ncbi:MAG: hypothetical protein WAU59_02650 [Rhodoplanes sp.]
MPAFISPLDGNYIALKRAALLIAREQPGIEPGEIMELFKHAIFTGEFERAECRVQGIERTDDRNLLLLRIEAPPTNRFPRLPLDAQPQEYFAVKGATVAEILSERDALPGCAEDWAAFAQFPRDAAARKDALGALAHIPYSAFPASGQAILGDIRLAKIKLQAWMRFKGYELPTFLCDPPPPAVRSHPVSAEDSHAKPPRGRPRKPGWMRVEQLIREMHAANPAMPLGTLAFDACKQAATEYPKRDLPSWETVLRNMKIILSESRPPTRPVP